MVTWLSATQPDRDLTSGDALINIVSVLFAPVSILGLVEALQVWLLLVVHLLPVVVVLVLLLLLEHLQVHGVVVGLPLLVPQVLVD